MTDNIIVSEVDGPPDVVKCFIREEDGLEGQSRELVVIRLEYIDVFEGVEQDEARKKLRLRTVGYTVAAFYFKDHTAPNRRFYILLKATGRLDFVNLDYKIVKSCSKIHYEQLWFLICHALKFTRFLLRTFFVWKKQTLS